jgi:hypothetical protein
VRGAAACVSQPLPAVLSSSHSTSDMARYLTPDPTSARSGYRRPDGSVDVPLALQESMSPFFNIGADVQPAQPASGELPRAAGPRVVTPHPAAAVPLVQDTPPRAHTPAASRTGPRGSDSLTDLRLNFTPGRTPSVRKYARRGPRGTPPPIYYVGPYSPRRPAMLAQMRAVAASE